MSNSNDPSEPENVDDTYASDCEATNIYEPFIGQEFNSIDDAYDFYKAYALQKGFGTRKSSSSKSKATNELIWKKFECDKSGFKKIYDEVGPETIRHRETRVGCKAKLDIRRNKHEQWVITGITKEHNHELDTPRRSKKHRSHNTSHQNPIAINLMNQLHDSGMGPSRIARTLNATNTSSHITAQNVSYRLRELHKDHMGREGVQVYKYLQQQKELDPMFYYAIELDSYGFLQSIFWADSRARHDFFCFSDVIIFDVTYRTNKFKMPFAPFTGVNHHRQSTLFGCALIADETEETFTWLFTHWLACMFDKAPSTIITDMDCAMYNAIKKVFPSSRHRFCSWHVHKHLVEHIHALRDNESEFSMDYKRWFYSKTVASCDMKWEAFVSKYQIDSDSWLGKMLTKHQLQLQVMNMHILP